MEQPNWWLCLIIVILATFRLTVLLSEDILPFRLGSKLRGWLARKSKTNTIVRKSAIAQGVSCPKCSSTWFAAIMSAFVFLHSSIPIEILVWLDGLTLLLALSGATIIINRAFPSK